MSQCQNRTINNTKTILRFILSTFGFLVWMILLLSVTKVTRADIIALNGTALFALGIVFFIGSIWLYEFRNFRNKRIKKKPYNVKDEEQFNYLLLNFLVHLLGADDASKTTEFKFLEKNFLNYFTQKKTTQLMELLISDFMVNPANLEDLFNDTAEELSSAERSLLIYLLVATATVDGLLSNAERAVLIRISDGIGISKRELESNLRLFQFETESQRRERETDQKWSNMSREERGKYHQKKEEERKRNKKPLYTLDTSYQILEIDSSTSNRHVKKAFRKLVLKYHPDRLGNLGEAHKKIAEEKFRRIVEAYEIIKKSRAMK